MSICAVPAAALEVLEISSYIRGYHTYMWNPGQGQMLLVKWEPTNNKEEKAVGVFLEYVVVGHVPTILHNDFLIFCKSDVKKDFV